MKSVPVIEARRAALAHKGLTEGPPNGIMANWQYTPEAEAKYLAPYRKK